MRKEYVFIIQHKETRRIHGCFKHKSKAEKYIGVGTPMYTGRLHIMKSEVEKGL